MGFFKKLGKKMRGFFKRIGKGIKKGVAKFGKFMGKIGILGQIAMMFILPGIGSMMLKGLGGLTGLSGATAVAAGGTGATAAATTAAASSVAAGATTAAATAAAQSAALGTVGGFTAAAAGSSSVIAKGVAWTLKTAQRFANSPLLKPFKTVTDAVSGFMENTAKFVGNKVGLGDIKPGSKFANYFNEAPDKFFGKGENTVLGRVGKSVTDNWSSFKDDIAAGDIFMSGDKDLSLTKAYDKGLEEKLNQDNFYKEAQASIIPGLDDASLSASVSSGNKLTLQDENYLASIENKNNPFTASSQNIKTGLDDAITPPPKVEGFFSRMGDKITNLPQSSLDYAMDLPGKVGRSLLDAPATALKNMAVNTVMDRGGQQASGWYSNAGPVYTPGTNRAENYDAGSRQVTASATSQLFGSDYDYFTASQADQYGVDAGGTWGNYMGNQRVA